MEESKIRSLENKLFFKRWLKAPRQLGTVAPISARLAKLAAKSINYMPGKPIVEIGAGTGRLSRALIEMGVKKEDLMLVELDLEMCHFLRETLPGVRIIHGDAATLAELIPDLVGQVTTVISVIPFMYLPPEMRLQITKSAFDVMTKDGVMLQVTYNPRSPLAGLSNLKAQRQAAVWFNLPPGFVWMYSNIDHALHSC